MTDLRYATACTVKIGPFLDSVDGATPETGLTIAQADVRLTKCGGDYAQKNEASNATHDEKGEYDCPLDVTDTGTLGPMKMTVQMAGALPVWEYYDVLTQAEYDRKYGSTLQTVNVTQIEGADATNQIAASVVGAKVDLVDAPNSTAVSALSAGNWSYTSRTLTSFGTLVADIWGALTSALTASGSIGKALADLLAVFNATVRTLTQSAAQVAAATAGPDLAVTRYTTFTATLTGMTIPADWDVIWLTAKRSVLDLDVDSQIMIRETTGGAATDGLKFVNRTAATAAQYGFASLTVNQGAGSIVVTIHGDGTALLRDGAYHYDIKCLRSDADDTISQLAREAAFDVDSSYTVEID